MDLLEEHWDSALINDGDIITIDASANTIQVRLSEDELSTRKSLWKRPEPRYKNGVLNKYRLTVSTASTGCVTDDGCLNR